MIGTNSNYFSRTQSRVRKKHKILSIAKQKKCVQKYNFIDFLNIIYNEILLIFHEIFANTTDYENEEKKIKNLIDNIFDTLIILKFEEKKYPKLSIDIFVNSKKNHNFIFKNIFDEYLIYKFDENYFLESRILANFLDKYIDINKSIDFKNLVYDEKDEEDENIETKIQFRKKEKEIYKNLKDIKIIRDITDDIFENINNYLLNQKIINNYEIIEEKKNDNDINQTNASIVENEIIDLTNLNISTITQEEEEEFEKILNEQKQSYKILNNKLVEKNFTINNINYEIFRPNDDITMIFIDDKYKIDHFTIHLSTKEIKNENQCQRIHFKIFLDNKESKYINIIKQEKKFILKKRDDIMKYMNNSQNSFVSNILQYINDIYFIYFLEAINFITMRNERRKIIKFLKAIIKRFTRKSYSFSFIKKN